jgi:hypothetical protein
LSRNGHPPASLVEQVALLNVTSPPTFGELLARLYEMRYTGPCTFHFSEGLPRQVVLDHPVRVPLVMK